VTYLLKLLSQLSSRKVTWSVQIPLVLLQKIKLPDTKQFD